MSTNETLPHGTDSPVYRLKFIVLVALEVPSLLVSLIIFLHFASCRAVRAMDHQHSVFVLLFIGCVQALTDVTAALDFYHSGGIVRIKTTAFCVWWTFVDYALFSANASLMAWISIERHLLIFHRPLLGGAGTWKRWILHVVPWIFCPLSVSLFYTVTIIISPMCTSVWYFDSLLCGQPCYLATNWSSADVFVNTVLPITVIMIANLALIIRVIHQRATVAGRGRINWRNQRKMVIQLSVISVFYLAIWLPILIIQLAQLYIDVTFLAPQLDTFIFLAYIGPLILPFVCIPLIPKLLARVKNIVMRRQTAAVAPATNQRARHGIGQDTAGANTKAYPE